MRSMRYFMFLCGFVCSSFTFPLWAESGDFKKPIEFFVVIASYNNGKWCEKNLQSVFSQTYPHWSVYYINDCSEDDTEKLVDTYTQQQGMEHKCTIVHNQERLGALANMYNAIHHSSPDKVIVMLDGDDWLYNDTVFETLAQVYQDSQVWMTYGNFVIHPGGAKGWGEPLPKTVLENNSFRKYQKWVTSHLKTFYAKLFHNIQKESLLIEGKFFSVASDVAFMIPMLEMASKGHIRFIDQPLYIYNAGNPICDATIHRPLQFATDIYIRSFRPYEPLDSLFQPPEELATIEQDSSVALN